MKTNFQQTRRIKPLASAVRAAGKLWLPLLVGSVALVAGCSEEPAATATATPAAAPVVAAAAAVPKLGIRPQGDEEVAIDMSMIHSEDLKKIFTHIDTNIDEHVINLQKWMRISV